MTFLLARHGEAVRAAAVNPHVARDDAIVCGDATRYHQFSVWADDIFETAILVKETIPVVVPYNDAVVVDAYHFSVGIFDASVIQGCKCAVAINVAMRGSTAITGVKVRTHDHTIVVEAIRACLLCPWEVRNSEKGSITAALEDVTISITISINA